MNKQTPIIFVLLLAAAVFSWQIFWPAFLTTSAAAKEAANWQAKVDEANNLKTQLVSLKQKYEANEEKMERVKQALPKKEDTPGLLVQIEDLAIKSGLILDAIDLKFPDTKKSQEAVVSTPANAANPVLALAAAPRLSFKTAVIDVSVSGGYSSLLGFLASIENNLRLMDVTALSFDVNELNNEALVSFNNFKITLEAYFIGK